MLESNSCKAKILNNDGYAHALSGVPANNGATTGTMQLHLFAGTVPATADTALDMVGTHTYLGTYTSDDGVGATGLSFGAVAGTVLPKHPGELWKTGALAFSGHSAGAPSLTATFARLCAAGDNGQGANPATARIQLDVAQMGDPVPGDINLTSSTFFAGVDYAMGNYEFVKP